MKTHHLSQFKFRIGIPRLFPAVWLVAVIIAFKMAHGNWVNDNFKVQVNAIAVSGDNIFAGVANRLVNSSDEGKSWTEKLRGQLLISSLVVNRNNIYVATYDSIYLSTNFGREWSIISNGLTPTIPVWALAVNGNQVFAGTPAGIYLHTNNGAGWTSINNGLPTGTNVFSFAVAGNNTFAGCDIGTFVLTNNSTSWTEVLKGVGSGCFVVFNKSTIIAGIGPMGGIMRSTDTGKTWTIIAKGLPTPNIYVRSLAVDRGLIFAGTTVGSFFLSADNGSSWEPIDKTIPSGDQVLSIGVSDSNIFAGTMGGIWKRPLTEIVPFTNLKLFRIGLFHNTYMGNDYNFLCDSIPGAVWFDLYANDIQIMHDSGYSAWGRGVDVADQLDKMSGQHLKNGDTVTCYLVARSNTNRILAISHYVRITIDLNVNVEKNEGKIITSQLRISGLSIDCSSLKGKVRVSLYSLRGEKLFSQEGFAIKTRVPDRIPRGIYTVEIAGSFGKKSGVVMKR
jgi:photosystem II stability/assembly factor-like uncharacterized protein